MAAILNFDIMTGHSYFTFIKPFVSCFGIGNDQEMRQCHALSPAVFLLKCANYLIRAVAVCFLIEITSLSFHKKLPNILISARSFYTCVRRP